MTSSAREKFFHRRVLNKLFPSEEDSDSEDDEDIRKQLQTSVRTENVGLHDVTGKGRKRKLCEDEDFNLAPIDVSLQGKQSTSSYPFDITAVQKPVLFTVQESLPEGLGAAQKTLHQSNAENCDEQAARDTGSQLTQSTEQTSTLSKNQKRKLKKKRHKERVRSSGVQQTTPAPKEFTYETG
ncbi:hypothetical protein ACROYT_G008850 [Oculina patagonica]